MPPALVSHVRSLLLLSLFAVGCGASVETTPPSEAGVTTETSTSETSETSASLCCPISERPACCMAYGGSEEWCRGVTIERAMACDNLPDPSDSRWEKRVDANGCPFWYAPLSVPIACNPSKPPPSDSTCTWTDDAGVHSESCAASYGCCAAAAGGTRCVPRGPATPC